MKSKNWSILVIVTVLLGIGIIGLINYQLDPLWMADSPASLSEYREGFDERQQKTNYLCNTSTSYNAVILGSSRTTYLDATLINNYQAYNYAANSMNPTEYLGYLKNFEACTGTKPALIIIGLDFWGTNKNDAGQFENPEQYLSNSQSKTFLLKSLLSIDALRYSYLNAQYNSGSLPVDRALYNRMNEKREFGDDPDVREQRLRSQVKYYNEVAYGNYLYRENYRELLLAVKTAYPDAVFKVYTTPVMDTMLNILVEQGRVDDYIKWLEVATDVFGEVKHYMYQSFLANRSELFYDAQHFKPELGKLIIGELGLGDAVEKRNDIGIMLTMENIEEQMELLRANMLSE